LLPGRCFTLPYPVDVVARFTLRLRLTVALIPLRLIARLPRYAFTLRLVYVVAFALPRCLRSRLVVYGCYVCVGCCCLPVGLLLFTVVGWLLIAPRYARYGLPVWLTHYVCCIPVTHFALVVGCYC